MYTHIKTFHVRVHTRVDMKKSRSTLRQVPQRNGKPLNVWVSDDQKRQLDALADQTRVNRSELVRVALGLLFDQSEGGQLQLGFPRNGNQ